MFIISRILVFVLILASANNVFAAAFTTICHNELYASISAGDPLTILDIQSKKDFYRHNYEGSISVGDDLKNLYKYSDEIKNKNGKIVIVSLRGGKEAVKAANRLVKLGVNGSRIAILEGGILSAVNKVKCSCCKVSN